MGRMDTGDQQEGYDEPSKYAENCALIADLQTEIATLFGNERIDLAALECVAIRLGAVERAGCESLSELARMTQSAPNSRVYAENFQRHLSQQKLAFLTENLRKLF